MLIYHPLYDAYHCVFRLLLIIERLENVPVATVRLLDFYVLFPARVAKIRLPAELSYGRTLANKSYNPYHEISNQQSVFRELAVIQDAAFSCIVGAGLIDKQQFENGIIIRTSRRLPEEITVRIDQFEEQHPEILDFILDKLSDVAIFGEGGLKHRTGLMEYRYDNVS